MLEAENPGCVAHIKRAASKSAPFRKWADSMEGTTDYTMSRRTISPGVCTAINVTPQCVLQCALQWDRLYLRQKKNISQNQQFFFWEFCSLKPLPWLAFPKLLRTFWSVLPVAGSNFLGKLMKSGDIFIPGFWLWDSTKVRLIRLCYDQMKL